ncbi:hypothetical protein PG987_006815 [Apiospora arundinis]
MSNNTDAEENSEQLQQLGSGNTAQFLPFPRLPIDLRRQIWRATWEPRAIWPYDLVLNLRDRQTRGPRYGYVAWMPITSQVNQESREETLKMYHKIADSSYFQFKAFINYHLDTVMLDGLFSSCHSLNRAHLHRVENLSLGSLSRTPDVFRQNGMRTEDAVSYQTLGNFIYYAKARYFPSLRYVYIHTRWHFFNIADLRQELIRSVRPLMFRTKDEGALYIGPVVQLGQVVGFLMHFMNKKEAAHVDVADIEPAKQHQVWLDFIGVALWDTFRPQAWLAADGLTVYRRKRRSHKLL